MRETTLSPDDFIYPLFVGPGKGVKQRISSLPGQFHFSVDEARARGRGVANLGIPAVILFGVPEKKDAVGSEAWNAEGVVQKAIRAIKKAVPELIVIVDACFCEYTDHGHCGVVIDGELDNDATLENLGRAALSYAHAGVDVVAPSGMLDGFVGFLREAPRRGRLRQGRDPGVLGEVRVGLLRPVPRGRRLDARRPAIATATRWIPPTCRGDPRGLARRRRGRRHRHGQARARLPRRHRARSPTRSTCPSPPTTSPASTRCSRPPPRRAGSTTIASSSRR